MAEKGYTPQQGGGIEIALGDNFKWAATGFGAVVLGIAIYSFVMALTPSLNIAVVLLAGAVSLRVAVPGVVMLMRGVAGIIVVARRELGYRRQYLEDNSDRQ